MNRTQVSCIAGGFFTSWATWEALLISKEQQNIDKYDNMEEFQNHYALVR